MKIVPKLLVAVSALVLLAVGAFTIGPLQSVASDAPGQTCQMEDVLPTHGTLQLQYLHPSSAQDPDRNDYRLSGNLGWDQQGSLDCYDDGTIDWAYEHSIEYGIPVERIIWNKDFSSFGDAQPYLDTTVDSNPNHTELTVGIAKPERLRAGKDYSFSYDLMMSNNPDGGKQWIALWGQVVEKQCASGKPWCSGLNTGTGGKNYISDAWVGWKAGFAVNGTTCWKWRAGERPIDCSPKSQPTPPVATPATPTPATPTPTVDQPPSETPELTEPPAPTEPPKAPTTPTPRAIATQPAPPKPPPTAQGTVNGCNTYAENCENNPIYTNVPAEGYNWRNEPKITTVSNGTVLTARCYAKGGTTYNWAHSLNDPGPNPYDSNIYYSVQAPSGAWGFIPDTYFVRDKNGRLGLHSC